MSSVWQKHPDAFCWPEDEVALIRVTATNGRRHKDTGNIKARVQVWVQGKPAAPILTQGGLDLSAPDAVQSFLDVWARKCPKAGEEQRAQLEGYLTALEERLTQAFDDRDEQTAATQDDAYSIQHGATCRRVDAGWQPLANFSARIEEEQIIDDGVSQRGVFRISGHLAGGEPLGTLTIGFSEYGRMDWPIRWGARAIQEPGFSNRDHLRAAVQRLSGSVPRHTIYGHSGWRRIDATWWYLHAAGAIGGVVPEVSVVPDTSVQVLLGGNLRHLTLPVPPHDGERTAAVRTSLALCDLAPMAIMAPVLGAVFRAPICEVLPHDSSVYLIGPSGVFKSELCALAQAHYGAGFTRLSLPAQWSSTPNALERGAFEAKDALFTVDDFAPHLSPFERAKQQATAERFLRNIGNGAGRSRMDADGTLRPDYPPRGLVLSSGEDIPGGHSLGARVLAVQIAQGQVALDQLSTAQQHAAAGVYARCMAAFIQWLAPQIDALRRDLPPRLVALRDALTAQDSHARTPTAVASLLLGWELFLRFAVAVGAIDQAAAAATFGAAQDALLQLGRAQIEQAAAQEPARLFVDLICEALAGQRAHLTELAGSQPAEPQRWGWRLEEKAVWNADQHCLVPAATWQIAPGSRHIGWIADETTLYLLPSAAYAIAQQLASEKKEAVPVSDRTLWRRMHDAHMLASSDPAQGKHVRKHRIGKARPYVLHVWIRSIEGQMESDSGTTGTTGTAQVAPREKPGNLAPEGGTWNGNGAEFQVPDSGTRAPRAPLAAPLMAPMVPVVPESPAQRARSGSAPAIGGYGPNGDQQF